MTDNQLIEFAKKLQNNMMQQNKPTIKRTLEKN